MTPNSDKPVISPVFAQALANVRYPGFDADIVSMDLVLEARLDGTRAVVRLRPLAAPPEVREQLENDIAGVISGLAGVSELELDVPEPPQPKKPAGPRPLEGVKAVVPVASGKGGVGKSTVAVNLALGLAQQGLKVGLLDLDLYGPSIPLMLGLQGAQPGDAENGKIAPVQAHGIKVLSIGFLVGAERALIWRGPILMKAVKQLLHEVAWAPLDVLVLDLPPGTGDIQITMTQEVPIAGAVVVTTPQDVALVDAIKAVDMFNHTNAPVLGIVENMSYFICPDCDSRHEIFGHGSVRPLAARLGVPFLGEIPLDKAVREAMDVGRPIVESNAASGQAYQELARQVAARLNLAPEVK
ncbi:MAG: Mrp/NBP35 family ATP-binding protein [Desulfarculus sp.]|nr:Mrp/NBP35 family ATP-binding protein [Desulfarculus sp.]